MRKNTDIHKIRLLFVCLFGMVLIACLELKDPVYTAGMSKSKPVVYFERYQAEPGKLLKVETYGYLWEEKLTYRWRTDSRELETTESYYIPEEQDLEQFIEVTVSSESYEDQTIRVYCSRLPVMYLDMEDGLAVDSRENYKNADVILQGAGETADYQYVGMAEIRGRGNTSWEESKKPYKMRLFEKESLLGMDKSKKWVLLANYNNPSLLRNKLLFDLADKMGLASPESFWVDLIINGEYAGNYQLCEQIALGTVVDVKKGCLLELDEYYDEDMKFRSSKNQPIMFHEPELTDEDTDFMTYVENFVNTFERAIDAPDFSTEYEGETVGYDDLFDMDSLAKYWVANEVFYNCDFMRKSAWFYIDNLGTAYMGPVWDNDWSSGNPPCEEWDRWSVRQFDYMAQGENWYRSLVQDPKFRKKAREVYWNYRDEIGNIVAEDGDINSHYWMLYESALSNDRLWKYGGGYEADVTMLREWLINRISWLDQQFSTEESLKASLFCP